MNNKHSGTIRFEGRAYDVKVENGERYVKVEDSWLTVDEFVSGLSTEAKVKLAKVGKVALEDEAKGIRPPKGKYQYLAEDQYK